MFKRKRTGDKALYVHLRLDGGIFYVDGATGQGGWITERELIEKLNAVPRPDGLLLYSREAPEADPPEIVNRTFRHIADAMLTVQLVEKPHPDTKLPHQATALMIAAHTGSVQIVRDLLERGADLEARDDAGYTALMYAANMGQGEAAGILLDAGADSNARDHDDSTPLMFASQYGHTEVVQLLLARGADPSVRGRHGLTALGFARQNGYESVAALVEAAGGGA